MQAYDVVIIGAGHNALVCAAYLQSMVDVAGNFDIAKLKDLFKVLGPPNETLDFVRTMFTSPWDLLEEWFDSDKSVFSRSLG